MRTTVALLAVLALPVLPTAAQEVAGRATAPSDALGPLAANVRAKARLATLPEAERRAAFRARGWVVDNVASERVALYTTARLAPPQRAPLEALGVEFDELWVPPLAGRHPHGFHVATVPHARLLDVLARPEVVRMASIEVAYRPAAVNDVTAGVVDLSWIHQEKCGPGFDGSGVRVAVADSGFDLAHGDFGVPFEQFDVTDGASIASWGTDVSNTVIGHGTHVLGVLAGNGAQSGGKYRGVAPGVELALYKVGDDMSGQANIVHIIRALQRATEVGCRVFNLSYNGLDIYLDGSEPMCHAVDVANAAGVLVVVAGGNEADGYNHGEITLPAAGNGVIPWIANNTTGSWGSGWVLQFMLLWRDETALGEYQLALSVDNLGASEWIASAGTYTSARGTKMRLYDVFMQPAAGTTKTYALRITDTGATGGATTRAHLWDRNLFGGFADHQPQVTVLDPGVADGALAVGAWTHRKEWVASNGQPWWFDALTPGEVAGFSSQGPRIDGALKPELVAPGAVTITARDGAFANDPVYAIDDDGVPGGAASYYARWGTSMAAPVVAGAAALLFQAVPTATADDVRAALMATTSANPSTGAGSVEELGAGLIDVYAALHHLGAAPQCPALVASTPSVSVATGGAVDLHLNGGPALDGQVHFVLGSATGTAPGLPLGLVHLPLNAPDPYFELMLANPNGALFQGTLGVLVDDGRASARVVLPPLPVSFAGLVLDHAYVALHVPTLTPIFASNAVALQLVP